MTPTVRLILRKRGLNKMGGGTNAEMEARKKPRTTRSGERIQISPSPSKTQNGLLTPEPSTLAESQIPTGPLEEKDIFPFMDLPAELRLHIYHMALVRSHPIVLHIPRALEKTEDDPLPSLETTDHLRDPAELTRTQHSALRFPLDPPSSDPLPPLETTDHLRDPPEVTRTQRSALRTPLDPPSSDPIVPVILRLNQQIHKEALQFLYSENLFTLDLSSGIHTLAALHQRSRSLIKHIVLTIPSHHDLLDGFADLVRLGLRYCWGLKSFRIVLQASMSDDERPGGATSVYANAFHILRWLPRGCSVVLEGCVSETMRKVVWEEGRLMNVLDETSYLKRQHQMPERH